MIPTSEEFRFLRKKAGLTQQEVANLAGLSQALIARIERGTIDTRLSTAQKILDVIKENPKREQASTLDLGFIMHSPVIYCRKDQTVSYAVSLMERSEISQLPVMDGETAVGSVTDSALIRLIAEKGKRIAKKKIGEVMSKPFPVMDITEPYDKAVSLLKNNPALLVSRKGNIAGVITKADILKNII